MKNATLMARSEHMKYWKFFDNVESMNSFMSRRKGMCYYAVYNDKGYRIYLGSFMCKRVL
jgi:hypothetical protein